MVFNIFSFPHEHTAAFGRFKAHHTEVNDLYWAFIPALKTAFQKIRGKAESTTTVSVFPSTPTIARRYAPTLGEWAKHISKFENWTRLNTLMAASAYFEVYYKTVITLALSSHPGILFSDKSIIEGPILLKYENKAIKKLIDAEVVNCSTGGWSKRSAAFSRLFGTSYTDILDNISDFEKIRSIRNSVGHTFGRDTSKVEHRFDIDNGMHTVTEKRILKYLKLLVDTATTLDTFLLSKFIGPYEILYYYAKNLHTKNTDPKLEGKIIKQDAAVLKQFFYESTAIPTLSKGYCEELVMYYRSL